MQLNKAFGFEADAPPSPRGVAPHGDGAVRPSRPVLQTLVALPAHHVSRALEGARHRIQLHEISAPPPRAPAPAPLHTSPLGLLSLCPPISRHHHNSHHHTPLPRQPAKFTQGETLLLLSTPLHRPRPPPSDTSQSHAGTGPDSSSGAADSSHGSHVKQQQQQTQQQHHAGRAPRSSRTSSALPPSPALLLCPHRSPPVKLPSHRIVFCLDPPTSSRPFSSR
ncbi:hypothetical protein DFH27DRAFT_608224 [Peziza echinospora]|nr:hypothetical protein DFH27DRAFT_608224 [Peziza echinospora]